MSLLYFHDSSNPSSSSKFFLSKTSVSPSFPRFFGSFLEFQIRSFQKRVSFLRFHDSLDPSSSSKFFLFKTNVSLSQFFDSPSSSKFVPFKNECLSFVSTILRILLRVPNSSFPKLMSLLRFHDPPSSSKFFLSKTSVFLSFP